MRRVGRVAEGAALLRQYGGLTLHPGFESLTLRQACHSTTQDTYRIAHVRAPGPFRAFSDDSCLLRRDARRARSTHGLGRFVRWLGSTPRAPPWLTSTRRAPALGKAQDLPASRTDLCGLGKTCRLGSIRRSGFRGGRLEGRPGETTNNPRAHVASTTRRSLPHGLFFSAGILATAGLTRY